MKTKRTLLIATCALTLWSCVSSPKPAGEPAAQAPAPAAEPSIAELIEAGDAAGLKALFKGREKASQPAADGRYPLHAAVLKGSAEMVEILLAMGAEPDPKDAEGKTPLRYAIDAMDTRSAKALIAKGASVFSIDAAGVSPLDAAIAKGFVASVVDSLSVSAKGPKGETPLHTAVDRLSIEAVKALLALGPDLAARDGSGRTALDAAFLHPGNIEGAAIAELLVSRNAPSSIDDFAYFIRAVRDTNYTRARFADGATVLHEAVRYDHRGYLSFFLERGVPVDAKNASGATALHDAVRLGRLDAARLLLARKADPNAVDGSGDAPLHIALPGSAGQVAVDLLLDAGASTSIKNRAGNTALHLAVALGYGQPMIERLIAAGSPVDAANADGDTALALAMRRRNEALATTLAGRGASMYVKNLKGETPLSIALADGPSSTRILVAASPKGAKDESGDSPYHHATRLRSDPGDIAVLSELGLDPSARNNEGDTALHLAARLRAEAQGLALLAAGSDPLLANAAGATPLTTALTASGGPLVWFFTPEVLAAEDPSGNGPLHHAAMAGLADGAAYLARLGVPVDGKNDDGQTALMLALKRDSTGTVNALLALGADPGIRDSSGSTALHLAVYWRATECLKLLARSASSLDPRDYTGKTPLRDAVDRSDAQATAFLLERGADPLARDNSGETPLHAAARIADDRFTSALAAKAGRVDVRDDSGATPLLEAVYAENARSARALASLGASIHSRDSAGESPLSYALKKGGAVLQALLDQKTARSSDADGRSVIRVILEAKPSIDFIELALAAGASVDDRDAFGRSPLHVAATNGYAEIAELLVAAGADRFVRDSGGATPAVIALSRGDAMIAALFGASPNDADYLGETALHYAAAGGLDRAAQALLALEADTARRNAAGETPADVAARRGHAALAKLLAGE
ncbi:MAG TPA: ankyrin repeat domain-containing protein [Spirochaetales bacterium]|nr:ankyrin repeat domain-containing protein [Spirochaetales bacterium]